MPAANLQGLNIVHPVLESADPHDLLLGHAYPDLTAQLDLWTNLTFESEEPIAPRNDDHKKTSSIDEEEDDIQSPVTSEKTVPSNHVNVGGNSINQGAHHAGPIPGNLFDINSLLSGFGIDSFPVAHASQLQQPPTISPSLAQLLALHPTHNTLYNSGVPHFSALAPASSPSPSSYSRPSAPPMEEAPSKRQRTRKASVTYSESADGKEDGTSQAQTGLSAAEDKRRRNTAASARFRLKKKEREAALEGKAKELELKVTELERECEALRRENGWLKGLVVGVTGAAQGQSNSNQGLSVTSPSSISAGMKRNREDTA
ncbi:hypothetical protein CPB84DRAFT_1678405 [Gymnopilus junonius]|uniref:BZIP domain-containing protein n=1 Tax=Gymnopilus junonius TaxID=109634 RepID=A0A9P5NSE4_GYMJU|nr:hypothetical protein CPB84DRAFT_1678405 [Gymnopilus junonius]